MTTPHDPGRPRRGQSGRPRRICAACRRCRDLGGVGRRLRGRRARPCRLWADGDFMRMALSDGGRGVRAVVFIKAEAGSYPSVGRHHAPALRLERAMRDLYGTDPIGLPDTRPWLDHGRWPGRESEQRYAFLPVEGEGLHQIPVGPVHAGIIEPGHFRFTANGETVVRLEQRLGYVHKGVEGLFAGADIERRCASGRPPVGRQHRRLCLGLCPCRRGGARLAGAAAGDLVAGRHGRVGAHGAPHQRRWRNLQRCQRDRRPRPMRAAARGRAGDVAGLLRSSADDGLHRSRRRRRRSVERRHRPGPRPVGTPGGDAAEIQRVYDQCPRSRIAPSPPALFRRPWSASTPLAALSAAHRAAPSTRARPSPMRPTMAQTSTSGRARPATSMPA